MISIIIINFRQKKLAIDCINSFFNKLKSHALEVILINNSPEDDFSEIKSKLGNLTIIGNVNKGFSQANNLGVRHSKGEYLLFLNADTIIRNDFIHDFVESFKNTKFGAVGLKLFNSDGTFQLSFWKENTFLNEIDNKNAEERFRERDSEFMNKVENKFKSIGKVNWVTGAAMIVKKEVFLEAGGFDENFFLFYEDADLCKRLSDKGYDNYFFPGSNIVHYKGENINTKFRDETYFYAKQSQLLYYKKHNNFINNALLRIYLFLKFSFLYLFTFKKINLSIVKLTLGLKV